MSDDSGVWEAIRAARAAGFEVAPCDGLGRAVVLEGRTICIDVDHGEENVSAEVAAILRTCQKSTA